MDVKDYLTVEQVAKKIGLTEERVRELINLKEIRATKIGIQDVRLLKIEGATLYVEGLDAIDDTPVLDIKMRRLCKSMSE